ncbi:hypothetical protein B0H10DRAFT_2239742 [Mycena sp. CBHHK59/15]|nr:hypothetical protein B0H10DRAFT_2239742 [Mycena sp. CBHHK59/15]
MESAEQQLAKLQKQVARMKKQAKQREKAAKGAAPLDDELESEERSDNEGVVSFASAITPLGRLPPPPPRPTTILRKTKQGDKPAAAKICFNLRMRYEAGDLILLRGRALKHEIEEFTDGQRISVAHFTHQIHTSLKVVL